MTYKGYQIAAHVAVQECWDISVSRGGRVTLQSLHDRGEAITGNIVNYAIESDDGIEATADSLDDARAFIDKLTEEDAQ